MRPEEHFDLGRVRYVTQKNYVHLDMDDGRVVFMHKDQYGGNWPPPYYTLVKFKIVKGSYVKNPWKATLAEPCGEQA
jgi:hypothetical protein